MRRAAVICAAVALLSASAPPAAANSEIPRGKFGVLAGLRQHTGELGNQYGFGWLIGLSAGYQPPLGDSRFSIGGDWGVLWGRFNSDDPSIALDQLFLVEMHFGLKFRAALTESEPRFITASSGVTLVRADAAIPPDEKKIYAGGYAAVGIDQYLANRYLVALEARYGLIGNGPASLTLLLSFHFGEG